ncbi:hypothetical protein X728_09275 [Mesorhizobium sp. L103C120A0]|nr:hypothetical protein X728_09275 [Mesorhizobium sp. L103C120A0]
MEGFINLVIPAFDRFLRVVGAAALAVIAGFLIWWVW